MCTLTVIRPRDERVRLRLLFNRDEQRSRPQSLPPRWVELVGRRALMPLDPQSGGTWIGVNDAGLVACLLNGNLDAEPEVQRAWRARSSRGQIVPMVLRESELAVSRDRAAALDPRVYPPCTLVVLDAFGLFCFSSDGERWNVREHDVAREPFFATSSGLGDALVESPRRALFEDLLREEPHALAAQARLHEHQWPDWRHLSVNMSRADARTVCRTRIDFCTTQSENGVDAQVHTQHEPRACLFRHEHLNEDGSPGEPSEHAFDVREPIVDNRVPSRTQVSA